MFKVEVTKLDATVEHLYIMNEKADDFLQFIPRNYGVTKDEVVAHMMEDEDKHQLEAYLKLPNHFLDKEQTGKLVIYKVTSVYNETTEILEEVSEVVKEYVGQLIEWPYDELGNFRGNGWVSNVSG